MAARSGLFRSPHALSGTDSCAIDARLLRIAGVGMPEAKAFPGPIRFEGFELDLRSGELRKDGADPILLPGQSFQILKLLLEHPGEVEGRRQIQERLWPDDTIVEFEHSISAAMNRLRQALGDTAENPRYIETLSRRGYRFIARPQPALTPSDALHQDDHRPVTVTAPKLALHGVTCCSIGAWTFGLCGAGIYWERWPQSIITTLNEALRYLSGFASNRGPSPLFSLLNLGVRTEGSCRLLPVDGMLGTTARLPLGAW